MENLHGIKTIITFEATQREIDAVNTASAGKRLANQIECQAGMDEAYGMFSKAYDLLVHNIFMDGKIHNRTVAEWICDNSAGWDELGSWEDIVWQLSQEMAFILVIVDNSDD